MTKLEELKQAIATSEQKFKTAQGEMSENDKYNSIINYCWEITNNLRNYVYALENEIYRHQQNGHIPPIKGAGKMEQVLEVLGLDDDYDVSKPVIYASTNNRGGKEFSFEIPLKNNE